jgi:hypothetical protein
MSIRRRGLWVAYVLLYLFFGIALFTPSPDDPANIFSKDLFWQEAGETVYFFNMLMPLIGGILAADRMQRDVQLGVRELQNSAPLSRQSYILGKYSGALLSSLAPMLFWAAGVSIFVVLTGQAPADILWAVPVAFVTIAVPSFAFVVAFSLACPLVMPLRVYQILFTGYWFWGNFLNHRVFPTVSGTLLNSSGIYALQGFFGGQISRTSDPLHTPVEACLNIAVLGLCAACVLFTLDRYLAWQARRA